MNKICWVCKEKFVSKPGGHNARYCGSTCKNKYRYMSASTRLSKEEKQTGRRKSYVATKAHPDRYAKHLENGRESRFNVREWLRKYKEQKGCIDCGYNKHFAALQLDHTGEKKAAISDCRSSILRLQKEIKNGKCVVRCAICHAVKTWANKNNIKYKKGLAK